MTMWYVHPVNKVTNDEVTRRLSERGEGSAGSFEIQQLAEDGKWYDVVLIDFRLLKEMFDETDDRGGGDFAFLPFKRERSDETLKFVPEFLLRKSTSLKVKAALRFIREKEEREAAT